MIEKKVLFVDDEANIRKMFTQFFTRKGYQVHIAENAGEALDILGQENIQVIFLDLHLPEMNGIDLCKAIRKDISIAFIFAVTAYSSIFELSDCRSAGFDDYFQKPIDLHMLYEAAEDAFKRLERWKKK